MEMAGHFRKTCWGNRPKPHKTQKAPGQYLELFFGSAPLRALIFRSGRGGHRKIFLRP